MQNKQVNDGTYYVLKITEEWDTELCTGIANNDNGVDGRGTYTGRVLWDEMDGSQLWTAKARGSSMTEYGVNRTIGSEGVM